MSNRKPHIVIEDGISYALGEVKNNYILYDFEKILRYLDVKGKLLFGGEVYDV